MKRILLTSTALVAFAGAAAAEVSFTGDAKIGYNDKVEKGAYFNAGMFAKGSTELNGGLTAGFELDIDLAVKGNGAKPGSTFVQSGTITTSDYVLYLKSENAGMYFGDTKTAAEQLFDGGLKTAVYGDYALDNRFIRKSNVDGSKGTAATGNVGAVVRGDYNMGDWKFSVSGLGYNDLTGSNPDALTTVGALQAAATGSFGNYNVGLAVQQEDGKVYDEKGNSVNGMVGVYAGGTFSNIDFTLGHVRNTTAKTGSTLVKATYNAGAIKAGAFFIGETVDKSNKYGIEGQYKSGPVAVMAQLMRDENGGGAAAYTQFKVDGSYDMGNGLVVKAGGLTQSGGKDNEQAYIAGEYDLGGGASLLASHGYDKADSANDAIGDPEYNSGTTVQVKFKF